MHMITPRGKRAGGGRAQPCAFCGLSPSSKSYGMPGLEVRDSGGSLLEWQAPAPWPVCANCDVLVGAHDEPGLSRRIVPLLARRAGRLLSTSEAEHVAARHHAFFTALR
jgi:hypothetical protein